VAADVTIETLRYRLQHAVAAFGTLRIDRLTAPAIGAWRKISLFALARRMGTSLEMIDETYGHLAPDADEYELGLLDAFDTRAAVAGWTSSGHS